MGNTPKGKNVSRHQPTSLALKDVLVISGGYDADLQDNADTARNSLGDDYGNAIYIVDAKTGELYWWTGETDVLVTDPIKLEHDEMKYGFTGAPKLVDLNGDEVIDIMYAADLGGQIWRFDIENQLATADSRWLVDRIYGGRIADFQKGESSDALTAANNRKFYYSPDIALVGTEVDPFLTIAIGSGYRAHPLNETIDDRFYLIKDYNVTGPPVDANGDPEYTILYEDDLLDITAINLADEDETINLSEQTQLNQGWILGLSDNEKVLANSITLAGNIIFTTYTPPVVQYDESTCTANIGDGAAYIINIFDGSPVYDLVDTTSGLTVEDRKQELKSTGIPAEPLPVYTEGPTGNEAVVLVGKETLPIDVSVQPNPSYWYQDDIR